MRTRSSLEYTIPRRHNCRRSRQQQEAIPIVDKFPIQMADDRPMTEQLQAPTGGFESVIVVPPINAQNLNLKILVLINLVQNRIFRGGNDEEPHAHIRHFESITNNQSSVPTPVLIKAVEERLLLVVGHYLVNTITNPRVEARAITTRSGLSYTPVPPIPPPLFDENESLTEKETEVTKDKVLPSSKDIQPPVIQKSHDPVKPVSSPIAPELSFAQVNNSPPAKEPSK
ncbi:hypothetical protein Tco_0256126 [Tanacetum coccineum]